MGRPVVPVDRLATRTGVHAKGKAGQLQRVLLYSVPVVRAESMTSMESVLVFMNSVERVQRPRRHVPLRPGHVGVAGFTLERPMFGEMWIKEGEHVLIKLTDTYCYVLMQTVATEGYRRCSSLRRHLHDFLRERKD